MKVVILNDTRVNSHFGCEMVMDVLEKGLLGVGASFIECVKLTNYRSKDFLANLILPEDTDLVIVNGEGTCHHDNGFNLIKSVDKFPDIPFMLINSVWQSNSSDISTLKKYKYITVRESLSLKSLPKGLENVEVVPDLVFLSDKFKDLKFPDPVYDIGITDNVVGSVTGSINSKQSAKKVIGEYSKYKRLCCGRHHGVVTAAKMGIPFSAWPSNTHKIKGMMIDMGVEHLHFPTLNQAMQNIPDFFDEKINEYKKEAVNKIEKMFKNIKDLK